MNGKQAKRLRRIAKSEKEYKELKRVLVRGIKPTTAKIKPERKHKRKEAIPPTWPKTDDQKVQSRPLIVLKPVRHIIKVLGLEGDGVEVYKQELAKMPKCELDHFVLTH